MIRSQRAALILASASLDKSVIFMRHVPIDQIAAASA
jgi:hypothetical protein